MDRPVTRAFFRAAEGERCFVEITWAGLEVEVVTGEVGSSGRAQARTFGTAAERDAFVAQHVEEALRDGYVEGDPGDRAEPDPPDDEAERAEALRREHEGTAWVPRVEEGDDAPGASKIGGTPWLPHGTTWPVCPGCDQPLRFVLQLARDDVPEEARWAFREDLLQLFVCDASGKEGNPDWSCQADGQGWEPFAPSTLARHVRRDGGQADLREALPEALLDVRRRRALEVMVSYCSRVGDENTAALFAWKIDEERVGPSDWEVARSREAVAAGRFLFPARRVAGWTSVTEVPAYGDIGLDDVPLLEERFGLRCGHGDKLGGFPCWIHDPKVPACRGCGAAMRYLFQVTSNGLSPIAVGGDGTGWIFVCARCGEATFSYQS